MPNIVMFRNEVLEVELAQYANKRIAIRLLNKDKTPYAVATVNLPDVPIEEVIKNTGKTYVLIKNYAENVGILEALAKEGIIRDTLEEIPTGFVKVNVCELLIDLPKGDNNE